MFIKDGNEEECESTQFKTNIRLHSPTQEANCMSPYALLGPSQCPSSALRVAPVPPYDLLSN